MADPITAYSLISLAGNVMQFVEFSLKIISKGNEIYTSLDGTVKENFQIEKVAQELRTSSTRLVSGLSKCKSQSGGRSIDNDDESLFDITQSCEKIAGNLLDRLETLKVTPGKHRRWKSLRKALEAVWNQDKVESLVTTLESYQAQLNTRIIVSLRIRFEQLTELNVKQYEGLNRHANDTLNALKSFGSHQQRVQDKLQSIEDLILHRPPTPNNLTISPNEAPKALIQIPQLILPGHQDSDLHIAAANNDLKALRQALNTSHVNIDALNETGQTALHLAASDGNVRAAKFLCEYGASLHAEDHYGRRPLHCATENGHFAVVRFLLACGAIDMEDDEGKFAADYTKDDLIAWVLRLGDDAEVRDPLTGHTALINFSIHGRLDAVRSLIQYGANLQTKDERENTALMHASRLGYSSLAGLLCEANAGIEDQNSEGDSALMLAAAAGHADVVRLLLQCGASISHKDISRGYTALVKAILNSHWKIADILLEAGSSVEIFDKHGYRPLGMFAMIGQRPAIEWLIKANADIDAHHRNEPNTPLIESVLHPTEDSIIKVLLNAGACTEIRSTNGFTALSTAAINGNANHVRMLLNAGANAYHMQSDGWTPLAEACFRGHVEVTKILLDKGAYTGTRDTAQNTPLHQCCQSMNSECAWLLLTSGADHSPRNQDGQTPLVYAVLCGNLELVTLLLDHGANVETKDHHGHTPLTRAAQRGHLNCVRLLLDRGANISARNNERWTALSEACHCKKLEILKLLLDNGADKENRSTNAQRTEDGWTPLMLAAAVNDLRAIKILVQAGADVRAQNDSKRTAADITTSQSVLLYLQETRRT